MSDENDIDDTMDDQDAEIARIQARINDGSIWKMEGSVGRNAMEMIKAGWCILGEYGHYDYWGSYIPSRFEVKAGTLGSIGYQQTILN